MVNNKSGGFLMATKLQIHASFLKPYLSIIIFSLDEQRALRPLLNSVAKKFYEIRSTNFDKLCRTNPICGKDGNAPSSLLLTTNDQRLATREAQNKPNSNPNKPNWLEAQNEHNFFITND
jgi:hypothetical protein